VVTDPHAIRDVRCCGGTALAVAHGEFTRLARLGRREFFNIALFAVVVATLIQGVTLEPLARRLGVVAAEQPS
jgi:NhaP-type Na+/H+ and K+/H+ antiporter